MKKINLIFRIQATLIAVLFFTLNAQSQNWRDLDAKIVKTLADTTLVNAAEVTIMPGEKGKVHTHPAHFFYALTECHLNIHYSDGTIVKYDLMPGDCGFSDAERPHSTENVGPKPAKFLIVELKEHPYTGGK